MRGNLFTGIIKAKQLEYSEAHKNLIEAIRKAPQFSAVGFRQIVSSSLNCVLILTGDKQLLQYKQQF